MPLPATGSPRSRALADGLADTAPARAVVLVVPGPVDAPGLGLDGTAIHKAPEAGVQRIVAVVAHDEVLVRRHGHGPEVVADGLDDVGLLVADVLFFHGHAVAVKTLVTHGDDVAGQADDALDVVHRGIVGVFEDDDVTVGGIIATVDVAVGEGDLDAVGELAGQQVVAHQQGLDHGFRGDLVGLDHEGPDDERQDQRHQQGFAVFTDQRFLGGFLQQSTHGSSFFGIAAQACGPCTMPRHGAEGKYPEIICRTCPRSP